MTAIWVQRREERAGDDLAARVGWLLHRHHCWDPAGGPMSADIEETMDAVVALWREAAALRNEQEALEQEAKNRQYLAEDKMEEAEALWKPLLESHPEWDMDLWLGRDPRTAQALQRAEQDRLDGRV